MKEDEGWSGLQFQHYINHSGEVFAFSIWSWYICPVRMMTSSNGNFSALLAICAGNSPVPGEFPTQRPVTRSFDVYFHLRPDKRLSKQSWGWWFEAVSHSLWRHRNGPKNYAHVSCFLVWLLLGTGRLYLYSVGQSCDCSSSSEVTPMIKEDEYIRIVIKKTNKPHQNITKQNLCRLYGIFCLKAMQYAPFTHDGCHMSLSYETDECRSQKHIDY